ncbi:TetR/AcrR family transcriptional regulator [Subtercola lobariae]|uniref:TetR family transcriptional regulator n=1 Tax=Subtercola lobariae TaxID=1588641 RepID=A0A917EWS2_9MICO|nr:TetR/AcrR family transcriptional regulator [Subtercola lobariae]GGF27831.1 TetR family transcriptional regulator [Subtercola lobariae]
MPRDGRVVRKRLERAGLELMSEHGFDGTTAEQIAARAGVTERTFFRHFPDKREVLFASEDELHEVTVDALAAVPLDLDALPALQRAFHGVVPLIERNRTLAALRAPIIRASPSLMERELAKTSSLIELVADGLKWRGVSEITALFCAQVGMDAFSTAIRRWNAATHGSTAAVGTFAAVGTPAAAGTADLHEELDEVFDDLRVMTQTLTPTAVR